MQMVVVPAKSWNAMPQYHQGVVVFQSFAFTGKSGEAVRYAVLASRNMMHGKARYLSAFSCNF